MLVVGCGESGILAGIRLKQANIPFTIVEKNAGPGGTWWENSYPGARVDVANHFYCYSFEPNNDWTHFFAEQYELQDYFTKVMDKHDLAEHVRWNTEVLAAEWNDDDGMWSVSLRSADGQTEHACAHGPSSPRSVSSIGRYIPEFDGADTFEGPSFHSAAWDHSVDLTGKRVALIGAGASGFQIAPAIADDVEHLTVFQRTAQWMFPNPMYHDEVGDGVRWAMRHLPFYGRWYRFLVLWPGSDKGLDAAEGDPNYADQDYAVSDINAAARMMFIPVDHQPGRRRQRAAGQGDARLSRHRQADACRTTAAGCKRCSATTSNWCARRFGRSPPRGVVTEDGVTHDADVIVYATGFRHTDVLWPLKVTGRNGIDLHEMWGSRPYAYLGITVPEFPNFFIIYGPGTHLAHGGSLIFQSELQMRYIDQCLARLAETNVHSLEPTAEARRRVASADTGPDQEDGVVASRGQALLLQERRRGDPHRQPVAAQRVLGRGPRARLVTIRGGICDKRK